MRLNSSRPLVVEAPDRSLRPTRCRRVGRFPTERRHTIPEGRAVFIQQPQPTAVLGPVTEFHPTHQMTSLLRGEGGVEGTFRVRSDTVAAPAIARAPREHDGVGSPKRQRPGRKGSDRATSIRGSRRSSSVTGWGLEAVKPRPSSTRGRDQNRAGSRRHRHRE